MFVLRPDQLTLYRSMLFFGINPLTKSSICLCYELFGKQVCLPVKKGSLTTTNNLINHLLIWTLRETKVEKTLTVKSRPYSPYS